MEDSDVLQHLLRVENEASALAQDAQAEADRRVSARERAARERYASRYGKRVAELEADFEREAASAASAYRAALDAYRTKLERTPVDEERFAAAVAAYLFGAD